MEPIRDRTGVYYTKSDINILQLRVTLRELSTTQILTTKLSEISENESGIRMKQLTKEGLPQHQEFHEEKLVKWQEKILSEFEAIKYQRNKYKLGKFEKYHKLAVGRNRRKHSRIFTFIDEDNYFVEKPAIISSEDKIEDLLTRLNTTSLSDKTKEEEDREEEEVINKKKTFYFYIMADVAPKESLGDNISDHKILCQIKYDSCGRLTFDPDLNKKGQKPYRIEGLIKGNYIYEYTFEIVSPYDTSSFEKTSQQLTIQRPLHTDGIEFDRPTDYNVRFMFSGEILRCYFFPEDCGAIYVHYQIDLPTDWRIEGSSEVSGISEACYPLIGTNGPVYHFSFPLSFAFLRGPKATGWPCMLLTVLAKGWLTNDCDQGFAAFTLPYPGHSDESVYKINLWRPSQTTISSKLTRHFIGGILLHRNSSYLNPSHDQGRKSMVSRLGLRSESSGIIEIRLYSILQSNIEQSYEADLARWESSTHYYPATLAVIKAFQKSFTRLRAAKQNNEAYLQEQILFE